MRGIKRGVPISVISRPLSKYYRSMITRCSLHQRQPIEPRSKLNRRGSVDGCVVAELARGGVSPTPKLVGGCQGNGVSITSCDRRPAFVGGDVDGRGFAGCGVVAYAAVLVPPRPELIGCCYGHVVVEASRDRRP